MRLMSPFRKNFSRAAGPRILGTKKRPRLGAPFTWLLSGFDSLGFEFLKVILNEVD